MVQSSPLADRTVPPLAERGGELAFVYVVRKRVKSDAACVICCAQK